MKRALFLDRSVGEARGVVTLDGKPERLLIERDSDIPCQRLGAVMTARVAAIDRTLKAAFLQLPEGRDALIDLPQGLAEGASIEVEITAEARKDKGALARLIGASSGPPRMIADAPTLEARLAALGSGPIALGDAAREIADLAQEEALAILHPLPGGGLIAIEPTRALTAIDVDLGARKGPDAARAARAANLAAIETAARLLRLKGLTGLIVFDLVGKGHDGAAMTAAARAAFAPEGPAVNLGPISRFGLFELALPRTGAPLAERLADDHGRPTPETLALAFLRAIEREGCANPGARLTAAAAPAVAAIARLHEAKLADRLGPRFTIRPDPDAAPTEMSVAAQ